MSASNIDSKAAVKEAIESKNVKEDGQDANITQTDSVPEHINLKVASQDGAFIQFKIKKHSTMKKLMNTYCERTNIAKKDIKFMFDGEHIQEGNTPKQLGMMDGDVIEVYIHQTGGNRQPSRLFVQHPPELLFRKYPWI